MIEEKQFTKRLAPHEVCEAFLSLGFIPQRGIFNRDDKACGLGAVVRHKSPATDKLTSDDIERKAERVFGRTYTLAFIAGFDGAGLDQDYFEKTENECRRQGYEDGKAAAQAVFGGGQ